MHARRYQEHVVEAAIAHATGDGAARCGGVRCAWVMMDYQLDDLRAHSLAPIDAPTLRTHFGTALTRIGACRADGSPDAYSILADPNITGPDDADSSGLVEQLLADSSLRFLLPLATLKRLETKRPPDPKDVRKALEMLGNVSIQRKPC